MQRGAYSAWVYVALAFMMQIALLGSLLAVPGAIAASVAVDDQDTANIVLMVALGAGAIAGAVGAYFTFRDRWSCIEAFSSRFCAGIVNLSLLYVPVVALVYANVRGVQKIFGK
jgi:hypothetical protein